MVMEFVKRVTKMKAVKIILIIAIIIGIGVGGYFGYKYFKQWEANKYSEITMLKFNQELFLKKVTALSETITHVVNETAKTTTVVKPDNTYVELKDKVLELQKDEKANKEEIKKLREQLSEQRKAFLASDDTILISGKNDETYLLYRDTEGNLQPASDNIEKIIEHKDVSDIPVPIKEVEVVKKDWNIKAGGYYTFDKSYGVILSKGIINIKDYSLNASVLLSDFKDFNFAVGVDVGYSVGNNLELGVGYSTDKNYYLKLQYSF